MGNIRQMIVSFRCPLDQVDSWMAFNSVVPQAVIVKKINDNGSEATMEISGTPEAVVEAGNLAGQYQTVMYDLKVKFR